MPAQLTRRQFLLRAAAGLGAAVLVCGGTSILATIAPPFALIETDTQTGAAPMNEKVLVAYATRCGSTMDVARAIAGEFEKNGKSVDLRAIKNVNSLQGYSAVVLGSAIRMGNWVPDALKFVEARQTELSMLPTAIFSVHMNNLGEDETSKTARAGYHNAVRKLIKPVSEVWFAGVIAIDKMSFLDRLITKAMKISNEDKRDWTVIRGWGKTLCAEI